MPTFRHSDFEFSVDDDWWAESGMANFTPIDRTFRVGSPEPGLEGKPILVLPIKDIAPLRRELKNGHGIFRDRESVMRIVEWFRADAPVSPVQVAKLRAGVGYTHRLFNGVHRFYCAVAAGFTHIPAIEVRGELAQTRSPLEAE